MDNDRQVFDYFLIVGAPSTSSTVWRDGDSREPQPMQVQGYGYGEDADDDDLVLSPTKADYPGDDRMRFDFNSTSNENSDTNSSASVKQQKLPSDLSALISSPPAGWTYGSSRDPIVDLAVINRTQGEQVPAGFVCVEKTVGRHVADLNAGSISAPSMFLCYRRGRDKPPLIYVDVFCEGQDNLSEAYAMELITQTREGRSANVNNTSSRPIYIMFGRAKAATYNPNELVVADLCVINASRGEVAPHTYFNMHKNLNTSFVGSTIYLGFRKALCKRNYFTYKPEILSSFPNSYVMNSSIGGEFRPPSIPLPQEVPLFCLPLGATLESWPCQAQMWSGTSKFVLTLSQEALDEHLPVTATDVETFDGNNELPRNKTSKSGRAAAVKAKPVQKLYGTVKILYEAVASDELSAEQVRLLTFNAFPWMPENAEYTTRISRVRSTVGSSRSDSVPVVDFNGPQSVGMGTTNSLEVEAPPVIVDAISHLDSSNVIVPPTDNADDERDGAPVPVQLESRVPAEGVTDETETLAADQVDATVENPVSSGNGGVRFWRARALCLLSRWPMFDAHSALLKHIAEMTSSMPPRMYPCPMERYLAYFYCRIPFPTPQRPRVLLQLGSGGSDNMQCISITIPTQASALPLSGCMLTQLVHVLSAHTIVRIMLYVLLEQKIVLHSLRPDILTIIAESISAVLFPFIWQCPYVPLCPLMLAHILHAPVPFIIGIDSRYFDLYRAADDIIAIDLDTESIRFPAASVAGNNSHVTIVADTSGNDRSSSSSAALLAAGGVAAEHFLGSLSAVSSGGKERKSSISTSTGVSNANRSGSGDGGGVVHNPSPKLALRILPQKPLKQLLKKLQEIQVRWKQESANNNKLLTAARCRTAAAAAGSAADASEMNNNTELLELSHAIRMRRNQYECELRECFLRFVAHLLKGYRQYLRPMQMSAIENSNFGAGRPDLTRSNSILGRNATDTTSLFDVQAFLHSRERAYQPFYEQLVKTQHFCRFIEERSIMSDEEASQAMAFFDQCLDVVEQQGSPEQASVRLISMDVLHDRTAFIPPPETAVPADIELRRILFETEANAARSNDAVRIVQNNADNCMLFQYNRLPKLNEQLLLLEVINLTKSTQNSLSHELHYQQPLQQTPLELRKLSTHSVQNCSYKISSENSSSSPTLVPHVAPSSPNGALFRSKSPILHKSHTIASPLVEHVRDELLDGIAIRTQYEHKAAQVLHESLRRMYYTSTSINGQSPSGSAATPATGNTGAKEWATLLLTNCYTLWFMYTPSYAAILEHVESPSPSENDNVTPSQTKNAVRFAYDTLIQMMEARLLSPATGTQTSFPSTNSSPSPNSQVTTIADQVCYRIVMFLCFRYGLERLAYQLLAEDMQKRFNIQPNAVTYGYYNKTVYETSQRSRQNLYLQESAENKLRIIEQQKQKLATRSLPVDSARARWTRLRNVVDAAWLFRLAGKEQFRRRQRKLFLQSADENFVCRKFEQNAAARGGLKENGVDLTDSKVSVKRTISSHIADRRRQSSAAAATPDYHQKRLEHVDFSESDRFRLRIGSIVRHSAALHAVSSVRPEITPLRTAETNHILAERPNLTTNSVQFVSAVGILFGGGTAAVRPLVESNNNNFAAAVARRRRMSSFAASFYSPPDIKTPFVADGLIHRRNRAATLSGAKSKIYAENSDDPLATAALRRQRSMKQHRFTFSRFMSGEQADEGESLPRKHLNTFSCDAGVQTFSALLRARSAAAARAAAEKRRRLQQHNPLQRRLTVDTASARTITSAANGSPVAALAYPEEEDAEDESDMRPLASTATTTDSNEAATMMTPTPPSSMNVASPDTVSNQTAEMSSDDPPNVAADDETTKSAVRLNSSEHSGTFSSGAADSTAPLELPNGPVTPVRLAPSAATSSTASQPQQPSIMGKLNSFFVKSSKSYSSFRKFIPNSVVSAITAVSTISDDEADDGNDTSRRPYGGSGQHKYSSTTVKAPLQPAAEQQQQRSNSIAEETRHSVTSTSTTAASSNKSISTTTTPVVMPQQKSGVEFMSSTSSFTSPEKAQSVRSTLNDSLNTAAAATAAMTSVVGKKLVELGSALSAGSAGMAYYGDTPSAAGYYFSAFGNTNTDNNSAAAAAAAGSSNSSLSSSAFSRDIKNKSRGGGEQESVNFTSTVTVQHVKNNSLSANDYSESLPSPSHSSFLRNLATTTSTPQTLRHRNDSVMEEKPFPDNYSISSTTKSDDSESITSEKQQKTDAGIRKTPTSFKKLLLSTPTGSEMRRAVSGISLGVSAMANKNMEEESVGFAAGASTMPVLNQATEQQLMLLSPHNMTSVTSTLTLPNPIVSVALCTTNQCEKCFSLLYDEEIMSNWQPDESNLNTVCTHCAHVFVPTLHISVACTDVATFGKLKQSLATAEGDNASWNGFRKLLSLSSTKPNPAAMADSTKFESCNSSEISSHTNSNDVNLTEISHDGVQNGGEQQYEEDEERFCVQYLSPLVLRKELESVFAREGELCLSWQSQSSASTSFVAEHAVVFWNLLFYFERLKRPHCLNALLFTTWLKRRFSAEDPTIQLPNQLLQQKFMPELSLCVQVSLLWDDAGVYYTSAAAASDAGVSQRPPLPLYCDDVEQHDDDDAKSPALANRLSALQLEGASSAAAAIGAEGNNESANILLSIVYRNDLLTPMTVLLRRRRRRQNVALSHGGADDAVVTPHQQHISLYRDLLFLLICHLGRENISKTQFDREYRKAYQVLLRNSGGSRHGDADDECENLAALLLPSDQPPSNRAVWCELVFSMFRDLEL